MKKTLIRLISSRIGTICILRLIRFYLSLLHVRVENESAWMDHIKNGGTIVLAVFHQQFFSLIRHYASYAHLNPIIMISSSRDGGVISPIAQLTGWRVARGSSSRGGRDAMHRMIEAISSGSGSLGANLVDGPTGPMGIVKPGVVRIAQQTGSAIVPCFVRADSAWHVNSWDRFMIPKPFSRVIIRFGAMVDTDKIKSNNDFEAIRAGLEAAMAPHLYL